MLLRLVVLLMLLLPARLSAQTPPDTGTAPAAAVFVYLQQGDTVAFEAVRTDSAVIRGVYLIPKQGSIAWDQWIENLTPTRLRLSLFPGEIASVMAAQETDFELMSDSMQVVTVTRDTTARVMEATIPNAVPAFGRSLTQLASIAYYAVQRRVSTQPLFLTSTGKSVTATIQVQGEVIAITVDGLRIESDWTDNALVEIRVPSQALVVRRVWN
jgi:hypothetical protein